MTSFVLHGGIFHLVSNMYFLVVFGDNVEDWLGKGRFILLLVGAALVGDIAHILSDPASSVPCVGASGGISGIVAFYAMKFPHAKLGVALRCYYAVFRWISGPAYVFFIFWLILQTIGTWLQLSGFSNVSSVAHLGGASVGMLFWALSRKE